MKSTRKTPTRLQNTAFFSQLQRRAHAGQKRAGLLDNQHTAFTFIPGKLNTNSLSFWIVFFGLLQAALGAVPNTNSPVKIDKKVRDLALSRIQYDQDAIDNGSNPAHCKMIADRVGALAATNSDFRENVLGVMSQATFKFVCTDSKTLKSYTATDSAMAGFIAKSNSMLLAIDALRDADLSHEMLHARMAQIHSIASNCYISTDLKNNIPEIPVHPFTQENIKRFEQCMTRGDNRIKELARILAKQRKQQALSQEEIFQLGRANEALQGVLLDIGSFRQHKLALNYLEDAGWPKKPVVMNFMQASIVVHKVDENDRGIIIHGHAETGIDAAMYGINSFHTIKEREPFTLKEIELAERLAYSLQQLDRKARHFLYPELSKLLAQEQQKCLRVVRSEL